MQALLFEMTPREGHEEHYFTHAAKLRPIVMQQEGLLFIERFKSLTRPNVILSHSLWRDEASIARWRTDREHYKSQTAGRYKHFENYRIRISHVLQRFSQNSQSESWSSDGLYSHSETTKDRYLIITRICKKPSQEQGDVFESVTEKNSFLIVQEVCSEEQGQTDVNSIQSDGSVNSTLLSRVSRDYGMFDRTEAPQYFEPIERQSIN